jgi:hypothetical protein
MRLTHAPDAVTVGSGRDDDDAPITRRVGVRRDADGSIPRGAGRASLR